MQEHYTPKGKHLTIGERRLVERWKKEGKSVFSREKSPNRLSSPIGHSYTYKQN